METLKQSFKIFSGPADFVKSEMRSWLDGHPRAIITHILQSQSDGDSGFNVTISIFYKETRGEVE
jgi:hypothetical protein